MPEVFIILAELWEYWDRVNGLSNVDQAETAKLIEDSFRVLPRTLDGYLQFRFLVRV